MSTTASPRQPLVSAAWLAAHLRDPNLFVLDIRTAAEGGQEAFEAGHVPGAVYSDYAKDGWRAARGMAAGMLPDETALAALFGRLGIRPEHHVVVVPPGRGASDFAAAARVYWTLKVAGHGAVSLLDGGLADWMSDPARPVATGPSEAHPAPAYPVRIDKTLRAELPEVERAVATGSAALVDARSGAYYEGREKSPQARVPGRLPGAVPGDFGRAYDAAGNRLKPAAELGRLFAPVPEGEAITYCNTGHLAAADWFVLSEVLGRPDTRLYDGSMSDWTQDPAHPVATGPRDEGEAKGSE